MKLNIIHYAVFTSIILISSYGHSSTATPANLKTCLASLNGHGKLKFKDFSEAELSQLNNLTYGISNNQLALFILTHGETITKNCPQNVTEFFTGKLDSSLIMLVKKLASQGNCPDIAACNERGRKFERIAKELAGGTAGLARANAADLRYTTASPTAAFESAKHSVCCSGPMGGKVNAGPEGGGYCEKNETIYPCFANTSDPLKDNDPGRAAFYKRFGKDRQLAEWISKYGGGNLSKPVRSTPASTGASGVGR